MILICIATTRYTVRIGKFGYIRSFTNLNFAMQTRNRESERARRDTSPTVSSTIECAVDITVFLAQ